MKIEASSALGAPLLPILGVPSPSLAAAIRIIYTGKPDCSVEKLSCADVFGAFGALSGMAKTWEAFVNSPSAETIKLEEQIPVAGQMRTQLKQMTKPSVAVIRRLDRNFEKAHLKPAFRAAYMKGQGDAADGMLDETGELRDGSSIRSDICYFIWVYWPEIRLLNSVAQLEKFFADMRQDGVTKKNLEKVCREIGLKFTGRGRPKNLFKRKRK